jgi:hypothetical protein
MAVDATVVDVVEPSEAPEPKESKDNPWSALDALNEREQRFVRAALQGKEWRDCGHAADVTTELGVIRMLGRPHVRHALEQLAPLVAALDAKRAARILRPYIMSKATNTALTASDAQSTQAIKELLQIDDRVSASLADVLGAIERRLSARVINAEVVKVPELPESTGDRESAGTRAIGIETVPAPPSSQASRPDAPAGTARGRGRGRGPKKPPA